MREVARLRYLLDAFLLVAAEPQLFLVAPQDTRASLDSRLGEDVVQVDSLVPTLVADNDKEGTMVGADAALDEGADPAVRGGVCVMVGRCASWRIIIIIIIIIIIVVVPLPRSKEEYCWLKGGW
jgi:hypothetical protein